MTQPGVLRMAVTWKRVRSNAFPWAARIDGAWHVLRLNDFPDHPFYTLFVAGARVGDLADLPGRGRLSRDDERESLAPHERQEVLVLMRGLGPYGSEFGQPCDGNFCTCDIMTDEWAARDT